MSERSFEVVRPSPGRGSLLEVRGDQAVFAASVAAPPGSTLEARASDLSISIKVRSCRSATLAGGGAGFRIEGRFVNLSRADREKLGG